jgi:pSer/pThr/pTyr-binding forkhead associated (FHA) protein
LAVQFAIALLIVQGPDEESRQKYICVPNSRTVAGRSGDAHIKVNDTKFSRQQVAFYADSKNLFVENISSRHPIFVNGDALEDRVRLKNGDEVSVGGTRFTVRMLG